MIQMTEIRRLDARSIGRRPVVRRITPDREKRALEERVSHLQGVIRIQWVMIAGLAAMCWAIAGMVI